MLPGALLATKTDLDKNGPGKIVDDWKTSGCTRIRLSREGQRKTMEDAWNATSGKQQASGGDRDDPTDEVCFFCGTVPEGAVLLRGQSGAICSSCVFSLSVRLAEAEREQVDPNDASPRQDTDDMLLGDEGELPAQEYESAADLAAAYLELGRRSSALEQYFQALEGSLACGDWAFSLRVVAKLRESADGPTVRDRIHEVLARHVPTEHEGERAEPS